MGHPSPSYIQIHRSIPQPFAVKNMYSNQNPYRAITAVLELGHHRRRLQSERESTMSTNGSSTLYLHLLKSPDIRRATTGKRRVLNSGVIVYLIVIKVVNSKYNSQSKQERREVEEQENEGSTLYIETPPWLIGGSIYYFGGVHGLFTRRVGFIDDDGNPLSHHRLLATPTAPEESCNRVDNVSTKVGNACNNGSAESFS